MSLRICLNISLPIILVVITQSAHADGWTRFGHAVGDLFTLGGQGRERKEARAKASEQAEKIRAESARESNIATLKQLEAQMDMLVQEIGFLNAIKNDATKIIADQDEIVAYARASRTFMSRLRTNITGLWSSARAREVNLAMLTRALRVEGAANVTEPLKQWDETIARLKELAAEINENDAYYLKDIIDHAPEVERKEFIEAVANLRVFFTMLFLRIDARLAVLEESKLNVTKQMEQLRN